MRCEGVAAAERESTAVVLAACLRSAVETRSVRICEVFFVTLKLRNLDFFPDTAYPCPARIGGQPSPSIDLDHEAASSRLCLRCSGMPIDLHGSLLAPHAPSRYSEPVQVASCRHGACMMSVAVVIYLCCAAPACTASAHAAVLYSRQRCQCLAPTTSRSVGVPLLLQYKQLVLAA